MNIAMESTEASHLLPAEHGAADNMGLLSIVGCLLQEYVNGQLKNKFGDAFIRGNNGVGGHVM